MAEQFNLISAIAEVQVYAAKMQKQPKTKKEIMVQLKNIRKGIRLCRKLINATKQYPMMPAITVPAKKTLDATEIALKKCQKEMNTNGSKRAADAGRSRV
jgi:hypothetical protein